MARKKNPEKVKSARLQIVMPEKLKNDFDKAAILEGTTMSDVIRDYIPKFIKRVMK